MHNHQKLTTYKLLFIFCLLSASFSFIFLDVHAAPIFQENLIYIVQQGDTLSSIALRFGISADELQSANNIADPNSLDIGQRLVIPGLEGISGVLTSETLPYGTSIQRLIRQFELNQADLIVLNRITSPSEVIAGAKFIIPINEDKPPLTPLTILTSGSTMIETAIQVNTSPWALISENQMKSTWDILPGETLFGTNDTKTGFSLLPGISAIAINNLPIIQGETLQVAVAVNIPLELSGHFNGMTLRFFSEDGKNFYSFHGIHALADSGPYPLEITTTYPDGASQSFEQLVLLSDGGYGNEWVNVPEEYLDETVITEEDAYLKPILSQVTSERYWEGPFKYPVDEPCVNSLFGQRRDYNNGGLFFYHTGMDFAVCAQNLNIYAPAAGKVVLAEELTIKGKAVLIDHGWGVFSGYWHLSEFNVTEGDLVQPGDLLGLIGSTGRSAGPHLHFEIDITGTPVNPDTWLNQEFPQPVP